MIFRGEGRWICYILVVPGHSRFYSALSLYGKTNKYFLSPAPSVIVALSVQRSKFTLYIKQFMQWCLRDWKGLYASIIILL